MIFRSENRVSKFTTSVLVVPACTRDWVGRSFIQQAHQPYFGLLGTRPTKARVSKLDFC